MEKFQFDIAFQEALIRFVIHDKYGYKALEYAKNGHFSLITHSVIYYTIEKAYERMGRVPSYPIFNELMKGTFEEREFAQSLSEDDMKEINDLVIDFYGGHAPDGDIILEEVAKFASYVELKETLEDVDLTNYDSYKNFSGKVQKSIDVANLKKDEKGIFLIGDIKERQMKRQVEDVVVPFPFHGVNRLTSAGGYGPGSIIVIIDRPKNLKTFALVNIARGYMRSKKKVLFIDLENGQDNLAMRLEQSVGKIDKKTLIKGDKDKDIQKVLRRYRRMGGEVYVRRIPAYSTVAAIQHEIDDIYREYGIQFDVLVVDYIALMKSASGKLDDETSNIGAAYVDIANLALANNFIHVVTAMHVVRTASVRSTTRYQDNDIAKAIDIIRHAHAIYGLNRDQDEIDAGIVRMEIVAQRDGVPTGRAYFYADAEVQRMDELTRREVAEIEALREEAEDRETNKPKKTGDV